MDANSALYGGSAIVPPPQRDQGFRDTFPRWANGVVSRNLVNLRCRIGLRLDKDVHLWHTGDREVQLDPFQPERLRREVGQAVLGRLSEAEIADVVDGAIAHLRYEVVPAKAEMLQGDEYDRVAQHMNTKRADCRNF
jgi:hypothetical protein